MGEMVLVILSASTNRAHSMKPTQTIHYWNNLSVKSLKKITVEFASKTWSSPLNGSDLMTPSKSQFLAELGSLMIWFAPRSDCTCSELTREEFGTSRRILPKRKKNTEPLGCGCTFCGEQQPLWTLRSNFSRSHVVRESCHPPPPTLRNFTKQQLYGNLLRKVVWGSNSFMFDGCKKRSMFAKDINLVINDNNTNNLPMVASNKNKNKRQKHPRKWKNFSLSTYVLRGTCTGVNMTIRYNPFPDLSLGTLWHRFKSAQSLYRSIESKPQYT